MDISTRDYFNDRFEDLKTYLDNRFLTIEKRLKYVENDVSDTKHIKSFLKGFLWVLSGLFAIVLTLIGIIL